MHDVPLILARLTDEDFRRFNLAQIRFSGSTGPRAAVSGHDMNGPYITPYIATFYDQLRPAVEAMGWKHFTIRVRDHQWVVKQRKTDRDA